MAVSEHLLQLSADQPPTQPTPNDAKRWPKLDFILEDSTSLAIIKHAVAVSLIVLER